MERDEELSIVRALLDSVLAGSTEMAEVEVELSAERYIAEERFERELDAIFLRTPWVVATSGELIDSGSFVTREVADVPILVTRARDGAPRAMLNVCRHRAARVVRAREGCVDRHRCPFHGWTYDSYGALASVPHPKGFPRLVTDENGLWQLPCAELGGLVWSVPSVGPWPLTLHDFLSGLLPDLEGLDLGGRAVAASSERVVGANWKLLVEGWLEAYHFRHAPAQTTNVSFLDNVQIATRFGAHVRTVYPRRSLPRLANDAPSTWQLTEHAEIVYALFPADVLVVRGAQVVWIAIRPEAVDRSRIELRTLVRRGTPPREVATEHALVERTVFGDGERAATIHANLAAGHAASVRFGRFEGELAAFHERVEIALHAPEPDAPTPRL